MDIRVSTKIDPMDLRENVKFGQKKRIRRYSILIKDSLLLLPASLDTLCKNFQVPVSKDVFPHSFVTKERLTYVGPTPASSY